MMFLTGWTTYRRPVPRTKVLSRSLTGPRGIAGGISGDDEASAVPLARVIRSRDNDPLTVSVPPAFGNPYLKARKWIDLARGL